MIKKIRSQDLAIGMFVADFNTSWMNHPFLANQKTIRSIRDIRIILDEGIEEVYIDTARGKDSPKAQRLDDADQELRARPQGEASERELDEQTGGVEEITGHDQTSFYHELRRAREIYVEAKELLQTLFEDVRTGRSVDGDRARVSVEQMIGSIFRNRDALLSLVRLKSFDEYTFHHSLNVAVLCISLGSHLGILQQELLHLGVGAVLHDVGKVHIPDEILSKAGPLTPQEFEVVKTHTAHGAKLLLAARSVPDECAAVALNHHERYNGDGYPRGLTGMAAGKFGLIASVADGYDAMTTERVYQESMPPHQALQKLYGWAGTAFHPIYVRKFIQCLGIYPVGSAVRLDTGEVGVVCRQNRSQILNPWVRIATGVEGRPLPEPRDADLREPDPEGEKAFARSVERVLDPAQTKLDIAALLALEEVPTTKDKITAVLG